MNRQSLIALTILSCLLLPSAAGAAEKPVIAGPVLNGANLDGFTPSRSDPDFQGLGLAGGSIFVIFGSDLGPAKLALGKVPYPDQLPPGPGGTRVTFRSVATEEVFQAFLIHSWQTQVSGIVPSRIPLGLAEVTVSYDGLESDPALVEISELRPALFTVSQSGRGPAVAQNYDSTISQPLNSLTHPAAPGQYIILWGTGLGPIDGPDNVRLPARNLRDDVSVRFASGEDEVVVPAEYAGRSPQFPGVDQINVRIPDDGSIDLGCYQELGLQIGHSGFGSLGTISISDTPGQCEHPWGLSAQKLNDLESGVKLTFMHLYLGSSYANGRIANADATGVASNAGSSSVRGPLLPFGRLCTASQFFTFSGGSPTAPAVVRLPPGLFAADPGPLRFVGPDLRAVQVAPDPYYGGSFRAKSELPEDFFIPGEWTLRSTGGKDVASFKTVFHIAPLPPIDLPTSVSASGEMELSWDPEPYQAGEQLEIYLREANPGQTSGSSVLCRLPASAGSLKVGAPEGATVGSTLQWRLALDGSPIQFTAPGLAHGQIVTQPSLTREAVVVE